MEDEKAGCSAYKQLLHHIHANKHYLETLKSLLQRQAKASNHPMNYREVWPTTKASVISIDWLRARLIVLLHGKIGRERLKRPRSRPAVGPL